MKKYIKASWDGIFKPKFIMRNSDLDEKQAKELSDYLYEKGYDVGFSTCRECTEWIEKTEGGFDEVYKHHIKK